MGTLHTVRYRQPQTYHLPERSQWPPHSHWLSWWLPASWPSPPPTSSEVTQATATVWPEASVDTVDTVWACGELALGTDIPVLVLAMVRIGRLWTRTRCRHCPSYWHRPCRSGNWNWQSLLIQITTRSIS